MVQGDKKDVPKLVSVANKKQEGNASIKPESIGDTMGKDSKKGDDEKKDEDRKKAGSDDVAAYSPAPKITVSLFAFWVLPVLMLAVASHFVMDTDSPTEPIVPKDRPVSINFGATGSSRVSSKKTHAKKNAEPTTRISPTPSKKRSVTSRPSPLPSSHTRWPTSYQETVDAIQRRNRKIPRTGMSSSSKQGARSGSTTGKKVDKPKRREDSGPVRDPARKQYEDKIDDYREIFQDNPTDVIKAIRLADALRLYDVTYHDGGTKQPEAITTYEKAIEMTVDKRQRMIENGEDTTMSTSGTRDVRGEVMMDYSHKSIDGLLCSMYTAKGKVYFMANMFEKAVETYSKCLLIEPLYLDALGSRGSSLIILGRYEEAAQDLMITINNDEQNFFNDAYTGLARILQAKESYLPEGWSAIVDKLNKLIPSLEGMISSVPSKEAKNMIGGTLNRLHHVMFTYHDVKTKDTAEAWDHLTQSYKYKMETLAPWQAGFEQQKIAQTMQIFHRGFWPSDVGSQSAVPIFIVGFVRSGSTLLERVLDAHPNIVGTGEDSVFNGRLDKIRNEIVEASVLGDPSMLASTVEVQADSVVKEMKERWEVIEANTAKSTTEEALRESLRPLRFVDKMLNNYYNIGFIHMLFPKALILHVIREPMDTIFSAYKHEFPPGTLDYTSNFSSLAELYHSYRDLMDHWDKELPGRVTHVRYEDLVHDMPGMAKSIIDATGLEWHDDVLSFHIKKHAVNTLSTTQVRKGIYKHSLKSWMKYEEQLQPLVNLIGDRIDPKRETTLPGYSKPEQATKVRHHEI